MVRPKKAAAVATTVVEEREKRPRGRPPKKLKVVPAEMPDEPAALPSLQVRNHRRAPLATNAVAENGTQGAKKPKVTRQRRHNRGPGNVYVCGQGDVGQLGLGDAIMERSRCTYVPMTSDEINNSCAGHIVDVCAGGMHTICLTEDGKVYSFGCNDEGALGRNTSVEGSECKPGLVYIPGGPVTIVQVTAGDSHTAALADDGRVYMWGNFRDTSGAMGLVYPGRKEEKPVRLAVSEEVVKISSGSDHLILLTDDGNVLTLGTAEQGQLGRVAERFSTRHARKGLISMLTPTPIQCKKTRYGKPIFDDIWAASNGTFARVKGSDAIFATGLNNYDQLGYPGMDVLYFPELITSFSKNKWVQIVGDIHHTLALSEAGQVHVLGRKEYGRLGLGSDTADAHEPTIVPSLALVKCVDVACGTSTSYAVASNGVAYAWGIGSSGQLGTGDEDDRWQPCVIAGKQMVNQQALAISGGAQHFTLIASRTD